MPIHNSSSRYGAVAKSFHWVIALGIFIAFPLGIIAHDAPYETTEQLAQKAQLFSVHKTIGVVVFLAALARILWALTQTRPAPLHPERKAETFVAEFVHFALYGALVVVPLSGWVHHAATVGFAPILWPFGQGLPFVPTSETLSKVASELHDLSKTILLVTVLLHIAGALKHVIIDRDDTLARMWPGGKPGTLTASAAHMMTPAVLALALWAAAIGGTLALTPAAPEAAPAPTLAEAEGDWKVTEGTLAISVTQFGKTVEGQFADWTANIAFEPQDTPGKAGEVQVTVSIPSLTLGSVTSQALGADFLNAEAHPTATFTADIMATETGYEAPGTLTLRGVDVPATLPFELTLDGNTATVSGQLTLDRRAFNVGDSMTDEGQLGFPVPVIVNLVAARDG